MPASDIINIIISLQAAQALAAGFGIPLIASCHTHNTDRIRFYSSTDGLVSDSFGVTEPEYTMVSSMLAQNPAPTSIAIGRRTLIPTMRWAVTPVAINNATYILKANGTVVSYTADGTATLTEIIAGLKTGIDALSLAVTVSDQTTYMRIVANTPGAYFTFEVVDTSRLGILQDNTDAGVATDLAAIKLEDSSWYCILTPYKSFAENQAIATWTEANKKFFIAESQDSTIITTTSSGATDIAATLHGQSLARTAVMYHQGDGSNAAAAWAGKVLPLSPGSETWKFKTLAGVTPTKLTDTHLTNLRAKFCNFYYTVVPGLSITAEGWVASSEWIDTTRGEDAFNADAGVRIINALAVAKKVPYEDEGAVIIEGELRASLQAFEDVGFFRRNPKYTVTAPKVADQSSTNRQQRYFPNLNFTAQLAGAIHKVGVNGTVTP